MSRHPNLEPKDIQNLLKKGEYFPLSLWVGDEAMKVRELFLRVEKAFSESKKTEVDVSHVSAQEVDFVDLWADIQSLSLFGKPKVIHVKDAESISELGSEWYHADLFKPRQLTDIDHLVVFHFTKIDSRKKVSKRLLELAPIVLCEAVEAADQLAWIEYLAKRRNLTSLSESQMVGLLGLDPWTLDRVDNELSIIELNPSWGRDQESLGLDSIRLVNELMTKENREYLRLIPLIAKKPEWALPWLGLLSWNTRMLWELVSGHANQSGSQSKYSPHNKVSKYRPHWSKEQLTLVTQSIKNIDYAFKGGAVTPLESLWELGKLCEKAPRI